MQYLPISTHTHTQMLAHSRAHAHISVTIPSAESSSRRVFHARVCVCPKLRSYLVIINIIKDSSLHCLHLITTFGDCFQTA